MEEKYFVISNTDGDTYVQEVSKQELEDNLNEDYYGEDVEFLSKTPHDDTNYWGEKYLIIKGTVIVPKAKEKVTKFEV